MLGGGFDSPTFRSKEFEMIVVTAKLFPLTIKVLHSDILSGCRYNNCACPVALAVRRAVTDKGFTFQEIRVYPRRISILCSDDAQFKCSVPEDVTRWIYDFDKGIESPITGAKPFEFTIEAPDL